MACLGGCKQVCVVFWRFNFILYLLPISLPFHVDKYIYHFITQIFPNLGSITYIYLQVHRPDLYDWFLYSVFSSKSKGAGATSKLTAAVSLRAAYQLRTAAEHWLLPGENENIWQAKVTRRLCLYKASIAGPSEHCKVIKHFVIGRYINVQQSSGITFPLPPSHCVWLVSLDFLLA